jgi:hypothetical protein
MSDVQDLDFVDSDAIENLVWVSDNHLHVHIRIIRLFRSARILRNELNRGNNRTEHIARAARTPPLEISSDFVDIGKRLRAIPDSHVTPCRFQ